MFAGFLIVFLMFALTLPGLSTAGNKKDVPLRADKYVSSTSVSLTKKERRNNDIRVTMYMTSWCPYCKKAKEYLNSLGVNLTEYDIEKDTAKRDEMKKHSGGSTSVPLIDIEGVIIRGFAPEAIKQAVEERKKYS